MPRDESVGRPGWDRSGSPRTVLGPILLVVSGLGFPFTQTVIARGGRLGPSLDDRRTKLSRLRPDEQFLYTFDLGDDWTHLCTVGPERIDPDEELGIVPDVPLAYWGWGTIPDQYGRRWDGDDGEGRMPRDSRGADLPPLRPGVGAGAEPMTSREVRPGPR